MVNDASRDSSVEEIRRFMSQKGKTMPLTIVNMSLYQGVELCMNAGLDLSIGDFIFEFDSLALSYPEGQIFEAYCTALTGYDIVSVRPRRSRSFTSRLFYGVFNRFSGSNYKIGTDIFRVLSRRALNRVHAISTTPAYRKRHTQPAGSSSMRSNCPARLPEPIPTSRCVFLLPSTLWSSTPMSAIGYAPGFRC